jgi:16S rRNA (guanine1516-N2)-methyltransferase
VGKNPNVLDATAGLGRETFLLAARGHHVTAVEKHPVLALLWSDALHHRTWSEGTARALKKRVRFLPADACHVLTNLEKRGAHEARPEVVYLDPMFPERLKSSAQVKKEARILQTLAGAIPDDEKEARELLVKARACALKKVVVKRPRHADPLAENPDQVVEGKAIRFDVYLTKA